MSETVDSVLAEMNGKPLPDQNVYTYARRIEAALARERAVFMGPTANCGHPTWNWRSESGCPKCVVELRESLAAERAQGIGWEMADGSNGSLRAVDVEAVLKVAEEMQGLAERQVGRSEMVSFPFTWAAALRKAIGDAK